MTQPKNKSTSIPSKSPMSSERRHKERRLILETFSVFVVIPKKGIHRLEVHDLSEMGIGFDLDIEGESSSDFIAKEGDIVDFRFYLNQSLFIPLTIQITRLEEHHTRRRVGAEFQETSSSNYQAFLSFVHLLDKIRDVVQVDSAQTNQK